jgi:ferric-dicitrate binding protein FerR (iron transport regulator)
MVDPSATPDPPADPALLEEQLVAYLDHELDEASSRRVEKLLATDPQVRQRLRQLQQSWDALDELLPADLDPSFTRSTLEMVALAAEQEARQPCGPAPRRRRAWLGLAGVALAGLAGYVAVWCFWPDPNQQLLRDLPVLENLDQYQKIDDIEFLRQLHARKLFAKEAADGS